MNIRILAVIVPIAIITLLLAKFLVTTPGILIFGIIGAILVALITFRNPADGLYILVFSMLLSPEIALGQVVKRSVVIRVDDLLIIAVFLAWLVRNATTKDWRGFIKTPLDKPLLLLFSIYVISTALGVIQGRIRLVTSIFYVLKYFEYFVLYWITVNIISSQKEVPRFITAAFITSILVTIYAYYLLPQHIRVYAPFDVEKGTLSGEPASLGGYFLMVFSFIMAQYITREKDSNWFLVYFLLIILPFIRTLSRSSYIGFVVLMACFLLFSPRKKFHLALLIIIGAILFPLVIPAYFAEMTERIKETFGGAGQVQVGNVDFKIQLSLLYRLKNWKSCFTVWLPRHPFLGHGITGVGLSDAQIPLFLGEIGTIGFSVFAYIIYKIYKTSFFVLKNTLSRYNQALALGLIVALTSLLFQSLGVNTFIIVRIMEPFWFLTAIVVGIIYADEVESLDRRESSQTRFARY